MTRSASARAGATGFTCAKPSLSRVTHSSSCASCAACPAERGAPPHGRREQASQLLSARPNFGVLLCVRSRLSARACSPARQTCALPRRRAGAPKTRVPSKQRVQGLPTRGARGSSVALRGVFPAAVRGGGFSSVWFPSNWPVLFSKRPRKAAIEIFFLLLGDPQAARGAWHVA